MKKTRFVYRQRFFLLVALATCIFAGLIVAHHICAVSWYQRKFSAVRVTIALVMLICASSYFAYVLYLLYRPYYGVTKTPFMRADLSSLTGNRLSHYYVHADGRYGHAIEQGLFSTPPFDSDGILLVDYGGETGKQHNPVILCLYALENWELLLQGDDQKRRAVFFEQADWLVEQQEEGKWYYHFTWKEKKVEAPWISGMAQGLGISVLLRAWQLAEAPKYLNAAEQAFKILEIPIDRGGVACRVGKGTWFEEFPNPSAPSHVMNGHIWTLFGIWDMWRVTGNPDALRLFNEGLVAQKADISKYDAGFWILYDQESKIPLNSHYFDFQIHQLTVLHALSGDPIFATYAAKWEAYRRNIANFCGVLRLVVRRKMHRLLDGC